MRQWDGRSLSATSDFWGEGPLVCVSQEAADLRPSRLTDCCQWKVLCCGMNGLFFSGRSSSGARKKNRSWETRGLRRSRRQVCDC